MARRRTDIMCIIGAHVGTRQRVMASLTSARPLTVPVLSLGVAARDDDRPNWCSTAPAFQSDFVPLHA